MTASSNVETSTQESRHAPIRRLDDNVYIRLEFLKAVSHSIGAHSSDLHTDATDSDSDSPDDDQASVVTVNTTDANDNANATDDCQMCLVAQRELGWHW